MGASNVHEVTQINATCIKEKIWNFIWVVENLSLNSPFKVGQVITSRAFQFNGKLYKLKLYPCGINNKYKDYMVLDISNKLDLEYYTSNVCLINKNGNEQFHFTFDCASSESYFFVARHRITSDFFPKLTIKWKLHYSVGEEFGKRLPQQSIENIAEKRRLAELNDFEKLLKDNRFSDIKIVVDKQTFFVHKGILAARCSYFAAMFESNMKEVKEGEIHITNISGNIMQEILRFIYTGKINVEMTMVADLLIAADMYGLDGLIKICEEAIISNMSLENIGNILTVTDRLSNTTKLKHSAIQFLTMNAKKLSGNEWFRKVLDSLSHSFMVEIMSIMMSKI